jgi:hypothetical protein
MLRRGSPDTVKNRTLWRYVGFRPRIVQHYPRATGMGGPAPILTSRQGATGASGPAPISGLSSGGSAAMRMACGRPPPRGARRQPRRSSLRPLLHRGHATGASIINRKLCSDARDTFMEEGSSERCRRQPGRSSLWPLIHSRGHVTRASVMDGNLCSDARGTFMEEGSSERCRQRAATD